MKKLSLIMLFSVVAFIAKADHITGGEMFYSYNGMANGQHVYNVTLKLFMRCMSGRMFPDPAIISAFDKTSFERIQDFSVPIGQRETIRLVNHDPCITNPPEVCYEVAYYFITVALPATASGYTLSSQVNYRIRGISNLDGSQVGATYSCEIPGTSPVADAYLNQSAVFVGSDLVEVCANSYFSYSFAAQNTDGDNIRYSFCAAYASTSGGVSGVPPGNPPYPSVPYWGGFSEIAPLGGRVNIDPNSGMVTGVAPDAGVYVLTVCAEEIRGGIVIATQRKDIQINVADCSVAGAVLPDDYMLCGTSTRLQATNMVSSPLIVSWNWAIFDPFGTQIHSSTSASLDYTFSPPNGMYSVRLIVNQGQPCSDTAIAPVYVFPGLVVDFTATGICYNKVTTFNDRSTVVSGAVNSWKWDFGESSTNTDVSTQQNNVYTYPTMGVKQISLTVTTTEGCRATVVKPTTIIDRPPITLGFRDTLICRNDRVVLQANGTGNFSWNPTINILDANTGTPTVFPDVTTQYVVDLETDGCRNQATVMVRVVDHVSLQAMADTTICRGDTIRLRIVSDGLQYTWSPASQVMNPGASNPFVITQESTRYEVIAKIGGCTTPGFITVNTVPYPYAFAGADTTICNKSSASLNGVTNANRWSWSASPTLTSTTSLHTVANPTASVTAYILTVSDSRSECNKPKSDTMIVTMLPRIIAYAGRDTAVIINQPLQLLATGGDRYEWTPQNFLSDPHIPNPVATYSEATAGIRYKVTVYNKAECWDTTSIVVKVFSTLPTVFVPTGFTPNNDGLNDVLRPIAVGMKQIDNFSIFNRWGDLVFTTKINGHGWDGKINGRDQGSNTYVWFVKAVDYNGKAYFHKGTVTLIR